MYSFNYINSFHIVPIVHLTGGPLPFWTILSCLFTYLFIYLFIYSIHYFNPSSPSCSNFWVPRKTAPSFCSIIVHASVSTAVNANVPAMCVYMYM